MKISKYSRTGGFTLLEILLVVLVIGIAAAALLPVAMESVDHARTRSALRDIIALNRYARSRAILDRKPTAVVYLTNPDNIQLLSLPARQDPESATLFDAPANPETDSSSQGPEVIRTRQLPKFVRIKDVKGAESESEGYFVIYEENGNSLSHTVQVLDPDGKQFNIQINGLTGEVSLEN